MKRKSAITVVILTALLGPLGLAYVGAGQALLGVLLSIVAYPVVLAADPKSFGIAVIGGWLVFIAVGWSMVNRHNQELEDAKSKEQRKHDELLAALKQKG